MTKRGFFRAVVSATVVIVLFKIMPLAAVVDALGRVSVWTWTVSLLIFATGHCLNALKLRVLLAAPAPPMSLCIRAQFAGLVANLGLPGLSGGDFVRAAYLAPAVGAKRVALASVTDRLIDGLTIVMLIAIALPIAGVPPVLARIVKSTGGSMLIAGAVLAALALGLVALRKHPASSARLLQAWEKFRRRRPALITAMAMSFFVQSAFVMVNVWLARQIGVTTALAPWFMAWPLSKLISVLPVSLGGLGVREAALVALLAPYGAPREAVLASGILWTAVLTVTGLVGLLITQMLPGPSRTAIDSTAREALDG